MSFVAASQLMPPPPPPSISTFLPYSSIPRDLIPSSLTDAPRLHVLPPIHPSFYTRFKVHVPPKEEPAAPLRPSARSATARNTETHSSSSNTSSSLGTSGTRAQTNNTHSLFWHLGQVQFRGDSKASFDALMHDVLREMYDKLNSLDEKRLLCYLVERAPGIAPRPYALWTGDDDHILLATEDCGDTFASATTLDDTRRDIIDAYRRVHAVGVVHGDVRLRHVLRDRLGDIRIVDWEGGRAVDTRSRSGRAAIERETDKVNCMLGI